jgi:putative ABC transport system substrate-binding protein
MSHHHRRRLLVVVAGILASTLTRAQQPSTKVYRIGFLAPGAAVLATTSEVADAIRQQGRDAFRQAMQRSGWVEGQNYVIDRRHDEGRPERYPNLAKELVEIGPDVLMSVQTPGIRALMQATRTIPIVMIAPGDPVGAGLIASLAHPGGNVTGLAFDVNLGTYLKQVEFMKEIVPQLASIAVFANPAARLPPVEPVAAAITSALGLKAVMAEARSADEIEPAFIRLKQQGVRAAVVIVDGLLSSNIERVTELGLKYRIALGCQWQGLPLAGGLMSYSPDIVDNFARSAFYVDRIFRGAKPADLPVELPTRVKLILNMKTAKTLGLVIPKSVLLRADQVIE